MSVKNFLTGNQRSKAQTMVEFALVMPLLLLIVYGLLEVGRLIFVNTTVVSAAREGARYGSASGIVTGTTMFRFRDCDGIKNAVKKVDILNSISVDDISISYYHVNDTSPFATSCSAAVNIVTGDRIRVQVSSVFTPLSGLVPLSPRTLVSWSERTMLGKVKVYGSVASMPPLLTVVVVGSGRVSSTDGNIHNCNSTCFFNYIAGTPVELIPTAIGSATFTGWSANCSVSGTHCNVNMTGDITVTATFSIDTKRLDVTKNGTGFGTVTSSPAGIDCGSTCSANFMTETTVILTATPPDASSVFVGWSDLACPGTGPCTQFMDTDKAVTATFEDTGLRAVDLLFTGLGTGTISNNYDLQTCSSSCTLVFPLNQPVELSGVPDGGSIFIGFGGTSCSGATCPLTMDINHSASVLFDPLVSALSVNKAGDGTGTVASNPPGIDCGSICVNTFDIGSSVTLTATPAAGSSFSVWGGNCSGTDPICTVTMDSMKTATAYFDVTGKKTLWVTKTGTGSGLVTSVPSGISCGATCSFAYTTGTTVALTAQASAGDEFTGWSGACGGASGQCIVTLDNAKAVVANFDHTVLPPCTFTSGTPFWTNSSKTITWVINNTSPAPPLDVPVLRVLIFFGGDNLQGVSFDDVPIYSGNVSPVMLSLPESGELGISLDPGPHTIVFSYRNPGSIVGKNFNASIYMIPGNCNIPTTGSWPVH